MCVPVLCSADICCHFVLQVDDRPAMGVVWKFDLAERQILPKMITREIQRSLRQGIQVQMISTTAPLWSVKSEIKCSGFEVSSQHSRSTSVLRSFGCWAVHVLKSLIQLAADITRSTKHTHTHVPRTGGACNLGIVGFYLGLLHRISLGTGNVVCCRPTVLPRFSTTEYVTLSQPAFFYGFAKEKSSIF